MTHLCAGSGGAGSSATGSTGTISAGGGVGGTGRTAGCTGSTAGGGASGTGGSAGISGAGSTGSGAGGTGRSAGGTGSTAGSTGSSGADTGSTAGGTGRTASGTGSTGSTAGGAGTTAGGTGRTASGTGSTGSTAGGAGTTAGGAGTTAGGTGSTAGSTWSTAGCTGSTAGGTGSTGSTAGGTGSTGSTAGGTGSTAGGTGSTAGSTGSTAGGGGSGGEDSCGCSGLQQKMQSAKCCFTSILLMSCARWYWYCDTYIYIYTYLRVCIYIYIYVCVCVVIWCVFHFFCKGIEKPSYMILYTFSFYSEKSKYIYIYIHWGIVTKLNFNGFCVPEVALYLPNIEEGDTHPVHQAINCLQFDTVWDILAHTMPNKTSFPICLCLSLPPSLNNIVRSKWGVSGPSYYLPHKAGPPREHTRTLRCNWLLVCQGILRLLPEVSWIEQRKLSGLQIFQKIVIIASGNPCTSQRKTLTAPQKFITTAPAAASSQKPCCSYRCRECPNPRSPLSFLQGRRYRRSPPAWAEQSVRLTQKWPWMKWWEVEMFHNFNNMLTIGISVDRSSPTASTKLIEGNPQTFWQGT